MTTTVSGLFDSRAEAAAAVNQLQAFGVAGDDISVVASGQNGEIEDSHVGADAGAGAGLGAAVGGLGGLLTGLGLMAIPGVGPVVAAGWLVSTAAGAAAGAVVGGAAGGIVGAMTSSGIPERDANVYAEGVRRGGTLVTARVEDADVGAATTILQRGSVDLDLRRADYERGGWTRFDPNAPPSAFRREDEI
ncbi:general stress protein [Kaistia nematophila]|uniref:General stress protein 17M-like domain-containing protein n=1 Tax=Kaistia nematophila TaxID=2994654 RepID=A0A9X3IN78_9HYPH|nr:general stress protein [Kaistia nematophila]MCX5570650.1 hypothetical protein [Kaistia nematophila]